MKKSIGFVTILLAVGMLFFAACDSVITPPEASRSGSAGGTVPETPPPLEDGKGIITINFGDGFARTILPGAQFDVYEFTFYKNGTALEPVTVNAGEDLVFTLDAGTYTLSIKAWKGAKTDANLAATGESGTFTVTAGGTSTVSVSLTGVTTTGTGYFSYTISFPAGTTVNTLTLGTTNLYTGYNSSTVNGVTTISKTVSVTAGRYFLIAALTLNGKEAGFADGVVISNTQTTYYGNSASDSAEGVFTAEDFYTPIVIVHPTGVTVSPSTATVATNATVTLTATVAPSNATNKAVVWSSSNTAAATVANGVVTGRSAGTATITATTADGGYTASCAVTVTGPALTGVSITGSGITLSGNATSGYSVDMTIGEVKEFTAAPTPATAGYKSITWSIVQQPGTHVTNPGSNYVAYFGSTAESTYSSGTATKTGASTYITARNYTNNITGTGIATVTVTIVGQDDTSKTATLTVNTTIHGTEALSTLPWRTAIKDYLGNSSILIGARQGGQIGYSTKSANNENFGELQFYSFYTASNSSTVSGSGNDWEKTLNVGSFSTSNITSVASSGASNGYYVHGHALNHANPNFNITPTWIIQYLAPRKRADYEALTAEQKEALKVRAQNALRTYITRMVQAGSNSSARLNGKRVIISWDVINEPISDSINAATYAGEPTWSRWLRPAYNAEGTANTDVSNTSYNGPAFNAENCFELTNPYRAALGDEYLYYLFLYAREAADAVGDYELGLVLNDYNDNQTSKQQGLLQVVKHINDQWTDPYPDAPGYPRKLVNVIGFQGHYNVSDDNWSNNSTLSLQTTLGYLKNGIGSSAFTASDGAGIKIAVSELDFMTVNYDRFNTVSSGYYRGGTGGTFGSLAGTDLTAAQLYALAWEVTRPASRLAQAKGWAKMFQAFKTHQDRIVRIGFFGSSDNSGDYRAMALAGVFEGNTYRTGSISTSSGRPAIQLEPTVSTSGGFDTLVTQEGTTGTGTFPRIHYMGTGFYAKPNYYAIMHPEKFYADHQDVTNYNPTNTPSVNAYRPSYGLTSY